MHYELTRALAALFSPLTFVAVIGMAGLLLSLTRHRAAGRGLMMTGVIVLVLCGLTPLGVVLMLPLEQRFPAWDASAGAPDGMVVLGGGYDRLFATVRLAGTYPNARIVFTGGNPTPIGNGSYTEADFAEPMLIGMGVPRERLVFERNSLNTLENAIASKALIQPKPGERWLLVTSAFHMPRAVALFRSAGFVIEPYPVGGVNRGWEDYLSLRSSVQGRIQQVSLALHEWLGLVAYRISGRSSELLPSPRPRGG